MTQLIVFCEGPTEQVFCAQVLQRHLFPDGNGIIHTLATGRKNHHPVHGIGYRGYERVRRFILNTIKHRAAQDVHFTTLFDLYGLPNDFPGIGLNVRNPADPTPYVVALEEAFAADVDCRQFIPYLQLHEFETLLFADPEAFHAAFDGCDKAIENLKRIAASVPTIEHINDRQETAPSTRIIAAIPEYGGRKTSAGPDIADYIGITAIRAKCRHFHDWLTRLEQLLREPE